DSRLTDSRLTDSRLTDSRLTDSRLTDSQLTDSTFLTNSFAIDITGSISSQNHVSFISINGVPTFLELAEVTVPLDHRVELAPGLNSITVEAEDLMGKRSSREITVIADHSGPRLSVMNFINGQQVNTPLADIIISFHDPSGVERVKLHDAEIRPGLEISGSMEASVALLPGVNTIVMEAEDGAGNITRGEIELHHGRMADASFMPPSFINPGSGVLVALNRQIETGYATDAHAPITKPSITKASITKASINDSGEMDTYPPEIVLRGLLQKVQSNAALTMTGRSNNNRFLIEGQVSDPGGVTSVMINQKPVITSLSGKEVVFNRLVELSQGDNIFYIEAADSAGNRAAREVRVHYSIQEIDMTESRISLSIMPFKNECISPALADSVYNLFVDKVINDARFNVVVRGEAFEAVLRELQLSQTDLVDNDKAVRAGRIVGSEAIMFGKIIETPDSIEIFVHLTDTETSRIIAAHDVYDQRKGRSDIEFLMQGLSSKFIYSVPLLEGKVLASKGGKFFLDLGRMKHANIQEGFKCIAFRSEPFIVDGMVLGEDITVLGTLLIQNVQDKISIASLVKESGADGGEAGIEKEDKVITK
ncbi:MAG: hypothetical protein HQK66_12980, partial [Desulfamplus sp.]|nr:hypothetical protein [Desulfamplus sp.]